MAVLIRAIEAAQVGPLAAEARCRPKPPGRTLERCHHGDRTGEHSPCYEFHDHGIQPVRYC